MLFNIFPPRLRGIIIQQSIARRARETFTFLVSAQLSFEIDELECKAKKGLKRINFSLFTSNFFVCALPFAFSVLCSG